MSVVKSFTELRAEEIPQTNAAAKALLDSARYSPLLEFAWEKDSISLKMQAWTDGTKLHCVCYQLHSLISPASVPAVQNLLRTERAFEPYHSHVCSLGQGSVVVTERVFATLPEVENDLANSLSLLHRQHCKLLTKLKSLPTMDSHPSRSEGDALSKYGKLVKDFLVHTGFRNIRSTENTQTRQYLVIVFVEEDTMPLPIRTFPIRFELFDKLTLRIFFSYNNSVATFNTKPEIIKSLLESLTEKVRERGYMLEYLADKKQVCLIRTGQVEVLAQNSETLNAAYLDIINTYKWISLGLFEHFQNPRKSIRDCVEKAAQHDPRNFIASSIYVSISEAEFAQLRRFEAAEQLRSIREAVEFDSSVKFLQQTPLEYTEVEKVMETNPYDIPDYLFGAFSLRASAKRYGLNISMNMQLTSKISRKAAISLPADGFPSADKLESHETSLFLDPRKHASLCIDMEHFCETSRESDWLILGTLFGMMVRLVFCSVLADPQLPAYLSLLGREERVEQVLGLAQYEGSWYFMHRYTSVSPSLAVCKRAATELLKLHKEGSAHGCFSRATITADGKLIFPSLSPRFFPLVARILPSEQINYLLDPCLADYCLYEIEPSSLEELQSADTFAVCTMISQYCLQELPSTTAVEWLQNGMRREERVSLTEVITFLDQVEKLI